MFALATPRGILALPNPQWNFAPRNSTRSGDFDQNDRVEDEQDRETDGPAVEVARDERASPERPCPGADAEGTREARVLARMHQDQEDQRHAQHNLNEVEDRCHRCSMVAGDWPCTRSS